MLSLDSQSVEICLFSDRLTRPIVFYPAVCMQIRYRQSNLIEVEAFIQFLTNSTFTLISLFNGHLSYQLHGGMSHAIKTTR